MTDISDVTEQGNEHRFDVTDDGKLSENEDHDDVEFEENLTFEAE